MPTTKTLALDSTLQDLIAKMQLVSNALDPTVQRDWDEDDPNSMAYIKNKPTGMWGERTINGNPIELKTRTAQTASSTKISFTPTQDLHGYDNPWPAGGGKNLFDTSNTEVGKALDTEGQIATNQNYQLTTIQCKQNTTYTASIGADSYSAGNVSLRIAEYDSNNTLLSFETIYYSGPITETQSVSITTSADAYYLYVSTRITTSKQQVEIGSTATSYAPYSNICPISGRSSVEIKGCGKNQFNKDDDSEILDKLYIDVNTEKITRGTSTKCVVIPCQPNTTYTISKTEGKRFIVGTTRIFPERNVNVYGIIENQTGTLITITTESQAVYLVAYVYSSSSTGDTKTWDEIVNSIQIAESNDVTITFGETVYGGTLDVEQGQVLVDKGIVDMGTLSWNRTTAYAHPVLYSSIEGKDHSSSSRLLSDTYTARNAAYSSASSFANAAEDCQCAAARTVNRIYVRDDSYTSTSAFKSAMSGHYLVYMLESPRTITLTPEQIQILKGQNTIWIEDEGASIELTYVDDEKNISSVASDLSNINSDMAPVESSASSDNYSIGDYLTLDGVFCKVISPIEVDDDIVIGVNVVETTIGAELKSALSS